VSWALFANLLDETLDGALCTLQSLVVSHTPGLRSLSFAFRLSAKHLQALPTLVLVAGDAIIHI